MSAQTESIIPISTFLFKIETVSDTEFVQAMTLLSETEKQRVNRYKFENMRQQALFVRTRLRKTLSDYCVDSGLALIEPQEWQFEAGEYGKPKLVEAQFKQTGIHFNLSHSGEYLYIGVLHSEQEYSDILLGVDIERERAKTDIHGILNRYFSETEIKELLALPAEKQRQRFFDLWALKESYIKATGKGLATRLDSFSFVFASNSELSDKVELTPEMQHQDKKWFTSFSRPIANYRVAVSAVSESMISFSMSSS